MLCKRGLLRRAASICLYLCVCYVRIVSKRTTILVFPYQTLWQRADGDPLTGRRMQVKNGNSSPSGPGRTRPLNAFWCNSKLKFQISEFYRTARRRKCHIFIRGRIQESALRGHLPPFSPPLPSLPFPSSFPLPSLPLPSFPVP